MKLPVIVVRGGGKPGVIEGNEDSTCGPKEFLRYIRDAELVITNSFHGTAFSLIFEKKFICVAHSTRNARLENVMNLLEENHSLISEKISSSWASCIVDGKKAFTKLIAYINDSEKYIKKSLK